MTSTPSEPAISRCSHPDRPLQDVLTWFGDLVPLLDDGGGVVPVCSKRCCSHRNCAAIGKHPLTHHSVKDASKDLAVIEAWDRQFPYCNVGLLGLVLLDVDFHPEAGRDGLEALARLCAENGHPDVFSAFPGLVQVMTGGGGLQFWALRDPNRGPLPNLKDKEGLGRGIEIRGDRQMCVIPPSIHPSGNQYEFLSDLRIPISTLPEWFDARIREAHGASKKPPTKRRPSSKRSDNAPVDGNLPHDSSISKPLGEAGPGKHREPAEPRSVVIYCDLRAYLKAVMRNAFNAIRGARALRNNTLNVRVYGLAQFIPGGYLAEEEVRALGAQAALPHIEAEVDPLDARAVAATIDSAVQAGMLRPLVLKNPGGTILPPPSPPVSLDLVPEMSVPSPQPKEAEAKNGSPASPGDETGERWSGCGVSWESSCPHGARIPLLHKSKRSVLLTYFDCESKTCAVGRHRWAHEKLKPVEKDFLTRPIYAVRFPDEKAWGAYRSQLKRLRRKGKEVPVYPVRLEVGGWLVFTTAAGSDAEPLENPLLVLHDALLASVGDVRPSGPWQRVRPRSGEYTRLEHRVDLVLLLITERGHLRPPLDATFEQITAWRIKLYTSNRTLSSPFSPEDVERLEEFERSSEAFKVAHGFVEAPVGTNEPGHSEAQSRARSARGPRPGRPVGASV